MPYSGASNKMLYCHQILFRIAMGIMKLNERSILQLRGSMEIMQFMKRVARVTHDSDRLIKVTCNMSLFLF